MDEPVLGTTGLQALAHDPLGGENLRKMGIETAITMSNSVEVHHTRQKQ
jgi:predicted benzoate:H+ symporter BenE